MIAKAEGLLIKERKKIFGTLVPKYLGAGLPLRTLPDKKKEGRAEARPSPSTNLTMGGSP